MDGILPGRPSRSSCSSSCGWACASSPAGASPATGRAWSGAWLARRGPPGRGGPVRGGGHGRGPRYATVYLIERSLSLDNLFVFLLIFGYFGVPAEYRGRLLVPGILAALVILGITIVGGLALLERFHFVVYVLAAGLLFLAYRMLRASARTSTPSATRSSAACGASSP